MRCKKHEHVDSGILALCGLVYSGFLVDRTARVAAGQGFHLGKFLGLVLD